MRLEHYIGGFFALVILVAWIDHHSYNWGRLGRLIERLRLLDRLCVVLLCVMAGAAYVGFALWPLYLLAEGQSWYWFTAWALVVIYGTGCAVVYLVQENRKR